MTVASFVLIGLVVAFLLIRLYRRFNKALMADEHHRKVDEKASAITYRISSIFMAILGVVFILINQTLHNGLEIIGVTLACSACAMMIVHFILYYYYKSTQ